MHTHTHMQLWSLGNSLDMGSMLYVCTYRHHHYQYHHHHYHHHHTTITTTIMTTRLVFQLGDVEVRLALELDWHWARLALD